MHASVVDWDRIEGFIGYGARNAPVVFIGMEEGAGSNDDLRSGLARRSLFDPIVELTLGASSYRRAGSRQVYAGRLPSGPFSPRLG